MQQCINFVGSLYMEVDCSIFGHIHVLVSWPGLRVGGNHNPLPRGRCWLGPKKCVPPYHKVNGVDDAEGCPMA